MQAEDQSKLADPITAEQKLRIAAAIQEQRARMEAEARSWGKAMARTFKGIVTRSERRRNLERMARRMQEAADA